MERIDVRCDFSRLEALFAEMSPRRRVQALGGALRKAARWLRAKAEAEAAASLAGVSHGAEIARGIWASASPSKGVRVSAGYRRGADAYEVDGGALRRVSKDRGAWLNSRGQLKPALMWLEGGTSARATRGGKNRGSVPACLFMKRTDERRGAEMVEMIRELALSETERIAMRHGCE